MCHVKTKERLELHCQMPGTARSPQKLGQRKEDSSLEPLDGGWPCQYFDLGFLGSRTVKEHIFAVLSYPVYGTVLEKPTNSNNHRGSFCAFKTLHPRSMPHLPHLALTRTLLHEGVGRERAAGVHRNLRPHVKLIQKSTHFQKSRFPEQRLALKIFFITIKITQKQINSFQSK